MAPMTSIERLSLNQATTEKWSVKEAVDGCARAGIPYIGLWRHKIEAYGLEASAKVARDAGIKVSSLCRGGMFPADTEEERRRRIDDNRRAVDEAAALGADVLVLVCGGLYGRDIDAARKMVERGIAEVAPYAKERGINLGIEPLHPMFAADRSVVVTLEQATDIALRVGADNVGVVIDVYHVWWDPNVYREIERAKGRILGFHVNDWIVPAPDMLRGRGMMGDGFIELRRMRKAVDEAGYAGPIEVEIFNEAIWDRPGDETLELMKARYLEHV